MADPHCVSPVTYTGMAVALIINSNGQENFTGKEAGWPDLGSRGLPSNHFG